MRYRSTAFAVVIAAAAMLAVGTGIAQAQGKGRPARLMGHPNLNGIWHAYNTAYWNLEAHSATALDKFWQLGAFGAIPAGESVIKGGGKIPYLQSALKKRDENRAGWPKADPAAKCYMPGIPRATYQPFPFQIFQGNDPDILMVYPFATSNRLIHMKNHIEPPVDTWMGRSNGHWDGDTLVIETHGFNGMAGSLRQLLQLHGTCHGAVQADGFLAHRLPGDDRGPYRLLEAVDDRDDPVPRYEPECETVAVQMRHIHGSAHVPRPAHEQAEKVRLGAACSRILAERQPRSERPAGTRRHLGSLTC